MASPKNRDASNDAAGAGYRLGYERHFHKRLLDDDDAELARDWTNRRGPSRFAGSEAPRDAINRVRDAVTTFTNRVVAEPSDPIESVNRLQRDELAATETYRQELDRIRDERGCDAGFQQLALVQRDHERAARALRLMVQELGGDADDGSGDVDTWHNTVTRICSDRASLSLLLQGEKSGLEHYLGALKDDRLPDEIKHSFRMRLVKCQEHIRTLEQMLESL